jgi:hypothetical protein
VLVQVRHVHAHVGVPEDTVGVLQDGVQGLVRRVARKRDGLTNVV